MPSRLQFYLLPIRDWNQTIDKTGKKIEQIAILLTPY